MVNCPRLDSKEREREIQVMGTSWKTRLAEGGGELKTTTPLPPRKKNGKKNNINGVHSKKKKSTMRRGGGSGQFFCIFLLVIRRQLTAVLYFEELDLVLETSFWLMLVHITLSAHFFLAVGAFYFRAFLPGLTRQLFLFYFINCFASVCCRSFFFFWCRYIFFYMWRLYVCVCVCSLFHCCCYYIIDFFFYI